MNQSIEEFKASQVEFVRKENVVELEQMLDDLSNRSRRNNLVVWGMPENSEREATDCKVLMQNLFATHMELEGSIEIERAHRRPIYVNLLRYGDREKILRIAPKSLKNKPYHGSKVYITDDVSKQVRADRKKLGVRY